MKAGCLEGVDVLINAGAAGAPGAAGWPGLTVKLPGKSRAGSMRAAYSSGGRAVGGSGAAAYFRMGCSLGSG